MVKVDIKEFPNLVGERIRLVSNGVVYQGKVTKVEPEFVFLNAGITDVPQIIRLDRRVMNPTSNFLYKLA